MNQKEFSCHDNCLLCGSGDLERMTEYSGNYLARCRSCSFVFSYRVPTLDELIEHYGNYGRNDYLSPITVSRYNEILDFLEPYRKTNRLIDVGCGIGHFLEVAKKRGWEVYGTEFTREAIEICEAKGITMHEGALDPSNYDPASFDVIISIEVIEHINNPHEELNHFSTILRDGGAIYLTTPNFNSLSRHYLKQHWGIIEYPEHLSYYTPATLNKMMSMHGMKKKWIRTTGISMTRFQTSTEIKKLRSELKDGQELQWEKVDLVSRESADEKLRGRIEGNPVLRLAKSAVNALLSLTGSGDSLKALFVKSK